VLTFAFSENKCYCDVHSWVIQKDLQYLKSFLYNFLES